MLNRATSDKRAVVAIGHRGWPEAAPENTLASFDKALELGLEWVETDLRATADGEIVLLHDAGVERTTNGYGPVAQMTLLEAKELDAGAWFDPEFAGQRIPTLREFMARCGNRCHYCLELKADGLEEDTIALLREFRLEKRATITSFQRSRIERAAKLAPHIHCGWLVDELNADLIRQAANCGFEQICPAATALTKAQVNHAHAAGLLVQAFGVRDEALMCHAIEVGVDGMTIDFPDKLLSYLRENQR